MNTETLQPLLVDDGGAAHLLGISRLHFRKLLASGRIDLVCYRLGRRKLYSVFDIEGFVRGGCRPCVRGAVE